MSRSSDLGEVSRLHGLSPARWRALAVLFRVRRAIERRVIGALAGLLAGVSEFPHGAGRAFAQSAGTAAVAPLTEPDPSQAAAIHARILLRIGRVEEAVAAFRALLAGGSTDEGLRGDYAEALIAAGLTDEAARVLDDYLNADPRARRLRRLRAAADLARGQARLAAERLVALLADEPRDAGIATDLATARLRQGRWMAALALYDDVLQRDPDNDDVRAAHRALFRDHAGRIELSHRTLFQASATTQTEEIAWRAWIAERWWLRAGVRRATYEQNPLPGLAGFTDEAHSFFALVGWQIAPRWTARAGLEESQRDDALRTTLRLGGTFDDAKGTTATADVAVRELLTNPVLAVPRNGTTDRVTMSAARRIVDRLTLFGQYEFRHYRVSGEELGQEWELAGRAEVELLRGRFQIVLIPQVVLSEYAAVADRPLRNLVAFIPRQDVVGIGALVGLEPLPGFRLQVGSVGRRDLHRAITSYEVTADARWRIHPRLDLNVLYTRNTESSLVGGKEETVIGGLQIRY